MDLEEPQRQSNVEPTHQAAPGKAKRAFQVPQLGSLWMGGVGRMLVDGSTNANGGKPQNGLCWKMELMTKTAVFQDQVPQTGGLGSRTRFHACGWGG